MAVLVPKPKSNTFQGWNEDQAPAVAGAFNVEQR